MPLSKFLQAYETFILGNASQVSSIESTIRALTYVLPGRFSDADLVSELLFSLLNVVGLYHDHVLVKAVNSAQAQGQLAVKPPHPSLLSRYHRYFFKHARSPSLYQTLSLLLTLLQFTESFIEMVIQKKWGTKAKWKAVTAIEFIKALCRLAVVHLASNRMVLSPSYPEREVEPEAVEQLLQAATVIPSPEGPASSNRTHWRGKLSGHQYRSVTAVTSELSRGTTISGYLMAQPNDPESLLSPPDVVSRLGRMGLTAEWLFILRPLIYVLAIRRWGPKSWVPWLLSLAIELGSRSLMNQRAGAHRLFGTRSQLEESELSRRTWLLLYYVLRSPFYERFTKPRLDGLIKTTSTKPLISLFTGILADYQPLWESVYFYTSGS